MVSNRPVEDIIVYLKILYIILLMAFYIWIINKPKFQPYSIPQKANPKCILCILFRCFMWLDHNYSSYLTCYKLGSNEYNAGKLYIWYLVYYKYGSPVPC